MIYDSSNDNHWQFVEATCNGTSANYVDTHVFDLYQPSSTTIKYECILCGKQLNTPEYDDRSILDDADYMAVFTLQKAYFVELANQDFLKAEGCLRAIDQIRSQSTYKSGSNSLYEYRDSSGNYVSPNTYEYISYTNGQEFIPAYVEVSVNRITVGNFILTSLVQSVLKNSAEILLTPFDELSKRAYGPMVLADLFELIQGIDEYTFAEQLYSAIHFVASAAVGAMETFVPKVAKTASKYSKILLIVGIAYDAYQYAKNQSRIPGNYAIVVDIYTTSGVDQFIGDYGYKYKNGSTAVNKHQKNIINEYFEPWDNGIYDPISPPPYNYCDISYIGVQDSSGNDKPSITLRLNG